MECTSRNKCEAMEWEWDGNGDWMGGMEWNGPGMEWNGWMDGWMDGEEGWMDGWMDGWNGMDGMEWNGMEDGMGV
jgi:hypothetical protein